MDAVNKFNVLLGNGFISALSKIDNEIKLKYSYSEILREVKNRIHGNKLLADFLEQKEIPNAEKITDIELLLWILDRSSTCLKYDEGIYTQLLVGSVADIQSDRKELKETVIDVLTDASFHPSWKSIFDNENIDENLKICADNLATSERIFTINYDLVLYWLLNSYGLLELRSSVDNKIENSGLFRDGFIIESKETALNLNAFNSIYNKENLLYLHGALHILSDGRSAYKIKRGNGSLSLQEIRVKLKDENSRYDNCLVFESSSKSKLVDIYRNDYLIKAYDKLRSLKGDLIVYGCKLPNESDSCVDEHLWTRALNSGIKNLYAACGASESDELGESAELLAKALEPYKHTNKKMNIYCFPYKKVSIWEEENFFEKAVSTSMFGKTI